MMQIFSISRRAMLFAMLASMFVFLAGGAMVSSTHDGYAQTPPAAGDETPKAPANSDPETVDKDGNRIKCDDVPAAQGGVLVGRIVPCLVYTIENSAARFSEELIDKLQPLFYSFLTFVIVMFGLKVLQNEGQLQAEALKLLIKIGFALTILALIPTYILPASYAIIDEGQAVVMETLADEGSINCEISRYKGANTPLIWAQVDCVLGKLYGFTTGADDASGKAQPNMLLASSIFGMLGGFFFGGSFGVALFFICVGVLVNMFTLVIRIIMAYVNSYLFIALYMIISPIFVPLMFLKVTTSNFDKWVSGVIAAMLMPMVISAYVVLALQMYDSLLFADDAKIKTLFDYPTVQKGMQQSKNACDKQLTNEPAFRAKALGVSEKSIYNSPFLQNLINPMLSGANNLCGGAKLPVFDLKATDSEYKSQKEGFERLFKEMFKILVMGWLIGEGFKTLMASIRPLLGSGAAVASLDQSSPEEQRLKAGFAGARQSFSNKLSYDDDGKATSGAGFMARVPAGIRAAIGEAGTSERQGSGFLGGITRNPGA